MTAHSYTIIMLVTCSSLTYGMEGGEHLFHYESDPVQSRAGKLPRQTVHGIQDPTPVRRPFSQLPENPYKHPRKQPILIADPYRDLYHQGQVIDHISPTRGDLLLTGPHEPKEPKTFPRINSEVGAYLGKTKSNLNQLTEMFSGIPLETIAHARARYLEQIQSFYDEGILTQMPTTLARSFSLAGSDAAGSSLLHWMIFLTDSFSFVEQLSQGPSVTQFERQQVQLSFDQQLFFDRARSALLLSSKKLLALVRGLLARYPDFFSGGAQREPSLEELKAILAGENQIDTLLYEICDQRESYFAWLFQNSPQSQEALLWGVVDQDPALASWKKQEGFDRKQPLAIFPSYKSFTKDFSFSDVKGSVGKYVGKGAGKFASVQDLVTALDQISYILEDKNLWISFLRSYSVESIKKVIKAITKAYPDVFIPSQRFILRYCTLRRAFKPVSFFIPDMGQFLLDAQNLTIEELAKKYGQGPQAMQSLLDMVYEAVYVLQQTNQTAQVAQLTALTRRIMILYPHLSPLEIASVVADQNIPLRLIFNAQLGLTEMLANARKDMFVVSQQNMNASLSGLSEALDTAAIELHVQELQGAAENQGAEGFSDASKLNRALENILKELNLVDQALAANLQAGGEGVATYQKQFSSLKREAMKIGLNVAYQGAKQKQDKLGEKLFNVIRELSSSRFLTPTLPPLWGTFFLEQESAFQSLNSWLAEEESPSEGNSQDRNLLVVRIAAKSAVEEQSESDFQACIWASNKMAMMESRIKYIEAFIRIKTTPLFITGYKGVLEVLKSDLDFLYHSRHLQKCLNVIARRTLLSQEIHKLAEEIKQAEKGKK